MQSVLTDIRAYDGKHAVSGNYIIVCIFSALLAMTAIGSFVVSCDPGAYFAKQCGAAKTGN